MSYGRGTFKALDLHPTNPNLLFGSGGKTAKYVKKYLRLPQKLCQSVFNTALSHDGGGGDSRYETPCILTCCVQFQYVLIRVLRATL